MNKEFLGRSEKIILTIFFLYIISCFFVDESVHNKNQTEINPEVLFKKMTILEEHGINLINQEKVIGICGTSLLILNQVQKVTFEKIAYLAEETKKTREIEEYCARIKHNLDHMGTPQWLTEIIIPVSLRRGVPAEILAAQIKRENASYDCGAVSLTGDYGLCQIHLAAHPHITRQQAEDPYFAVNYQAQLLIAHYEEFGSWWAALVSYNAGPTAFRKWEEPKESRRYANQILALAKIKE